jgi:hypothetical protein
MQLRSMIDVNRESGARPDPQVSSNCTLLSHPLTARLAGYRRAAVGMRRSRLQRPGQQTVRLHF